MPTSRRILFAALAVVVAFIAGCGGGERPGREAAAGTASSGPALLGAQVSADRKVVYTADLVVRVGDVGKASGRAIDETKRAGGFLFAQDADEESAATELTLKIPADRFEVLLDTVAGLGDVLQRAVKAQDVTAEVVDIEGRLKTAQASADRLRALLSDAKSATDVVAVEGELAKREADIESLQGRLRVLTDQVDLGTITVRFTERNELRVNDDLPGFLDGLNAGSVTLANVGLAAVVAAGFLLPFTPLAALTVWLVRRWRRRHPRAPRTPPTGWPPAPPVQPQDPRPASPTVPDLTG